MPVAGRKPKEGPKRNHMPATHDWVEVVDKPFAGKRPVALPRSRRMEIGGRMMPVSWEPLTMTWWRTVASMPHCALWTKSDWMFAVATAVVADDAFRGMKAAASELRQREKILGTTIDARRDLRIRYVEKLPESKKAVVPTSATVVSMDDRRRRSIESDEPSAP